MTALPNSTGSNTPPRVAVIGGGVTGLAAAHRLIELAREHGRPLDVTLLEAGPRVGGLAGTVRIGDYLVETGADMFLSSPPQAVRLCERLGLADELIPTAAAFRGSLVLRRGRPMRVPEGFMLLSPARIWPVLTSPIFSPPGKLRMGLELFLPRRRDAGTCDESLAAFVRRRFGREALDRLIQPLVGGIYTSDPERLSLKATLPRFLEMEREHRSLILAARRQPAGDRETEASGSGARYGLFVAPRQGLSQLFERLAEAIAAGGTLRLNTAVTELRRRADQRFDLTAVRDGKPETRAFDAVLVTLSAFRSADLLAGLSGAGRSCAGPACTDELAGAACAEPSRGSFDAARIESLCGLLRGIEYASAAIVVSGHRLADIVHPLDAFGLVVPAIERRRILAVSFGSRKFPGRAPEGRVLLRTFVGGALQPELLEQSDDDLRQMVRGELAEILGMRGEPDFMDVCRYERAMPQYHVGHLDRVAAIEQSLAALPGIELAGNAYRGVGIPDCVRSAESAAERIVAHLFPDSPGTAAAGLSTPAAIEPPPVSSADH